MPKRMRSLYQCYHARCIAGERIICMYGNISLPFYLLKQGKPLELAVCQKCAEFDCMEEAVKQEDRGWRD